ncbi:MAG: ATP-binding protein, partial [Rudaea sp.]
LDRIEAAQKTASAQLDRVELTLAELQVQTGRSEELEAAIKAHEARAAQLDKMLHDYEVGEALGEWIERAREVITESSIDKRLAEKTEERERAGARLRAGLIAPGIVLVVLVAATVLVPLALLLLTQNTSLAAAAGGGLLVADAAAAAVVARRGVAVWNKLEQATKELGKAQGEAATRRELARASQEKLHESETRLKEMGGLVPADPEIAQIWRIEIARNLENKTRDELNAERDAVREKLNYARAQRDDVIAQIQKLEAALDGDEPEQYRRKAEKANVALGRWRPLLAEQAGQLQVEPNVQSVREQKQGVESERKNWQQRVQQASRLRVQIQEGEARAQNLARELERSYEGARGLLDGSLPAWDASLDRSAYMDLGRALTKSFEEHGGEKVRSQLNAVEKELGACEREAKLREQALQNAVSQSLAILKELKLDELSDQPSQEDLDGLEARLGKLEFGDRAPLEARVRMLHQRAGSLSDTRRRLEGELGLQGETVELVPAREELEKERRQQEERKLGAEIVARARKRIVQKILPATMDYMRRILPQLTRDRYHDAELDPESYKIKVWDERAGQSGAWKEKNIFSGGTKDQFSLALRLAFALATLPQERGTSPGFIFLDEPLGSFDDERASALLYLLTEGEIAQAFDQIFLISHVRVDESRFTHQLRLENGAVVESTLEAGA